MDSLQPAARHVTIAGRRIGPGQPTFVIAEAGVNHNGSLELAHRLIEAAAATGADAVKFQTFSTDALVTADAPKAEYQRTYDPEQATQREMLQRLELPAAAWRELKADAESRGLVFLSTPFDLASLAVLADLDVDAIKISSGDVTFTPLLRAIGRLGRPAILSTGMSTLSDIARAIEDLGGLDREIVLLHCVSAYPAPPEACNLRVIPALTRIFPFPVGFSDHTVGIAAPLAAVSLGACVIEKHLTLDRTMTGPDHAASAEPDELRTMIESIRRIELALGKPFKRPQAAELDIARVARRALVAARDLCAGEVLDEGMLSARRPADGLPPTQIDAVVGRRLRRPVRANQPLAWDDQVWHGCDDGRAAR